MQLEPKTSHPVAESGLSITYRYILGKGAKKWSPLYGIIFKLK